MEETVREPAFRIKLTQNAKGDLRFEISVRGDTIEDVRDKTNALKKYAEELVKVVG